MKQISKAKIKSPSVASIRKVVEAARASGLDVAGIEVIDNAIMVFDARAMPTTAQASDEFSRWEQDGRI